MFLLFPLNISYMNVDGSINMGSLGLCLPKQRNKMVSVSRVFTVLEDTDTHTSERSSVIKKYRVTLKIPVETPISIHQRKCLG